VEQNKKPEWIATGEGHFIWALRRVYICPPSPAQAFSFPVFVKSRGLLRVMGKRRGEAADRVVRGWSWSFLDQRGW